MFHIFQSPKVPFSFAICLMILGCQTIDINKEDLPLKEEKLSSENVNVEFFSSCRNNLRAITFHQSYLVCGIQRGANVFYNVELMQKAPNNKYQLHTRFEPIRTFKVNRHEAKMEEVLLIPVENFTYRMPINNFTLDCEDNNSLCNLQSSCILSKQKSFHPHIIDDLKRQSPIQDNFANIRELIGEAFNGNLQAQEVIRSPEHWFQPNSKSYEIAKIYSKILDEKYRSSCLHRSKSFLISRY